MKKLKLSKTEKEQLIKEFEKSIEEYETDLNSNNLEFGKTLSARSKDKVRIVFTPSAYLRSQALVKNFSGEVGWNGLAKKIEKGVYFVYDVMVYPQVVSGARTLDPTKTNDWYDKYDDVLDQMHYQAHSHVNMGTGASDTDLNNQREIVRNSQGKGFKIFQIWNKSGDINTYLYDMDENVLYDRNDVEIDIAFEERNTLKTFIKEAKEIVEDMPKAEPLKFVEKISGKEYIREPFKVV